PEIQLAPGGAMEGLVLAGVVAFELQAFRRQLVIPGKGHPEWKSDRAGDHEPTGDPVRHSERPAQLRDALRERPHRADVYRRGAPDVAVAEVGDNAALPWRPVVAGHCRPRGSHRLQAGLQICASVELRVVLCKPGSRSVGLI